MQGEYTNHMCVLDYPDSLRLANWSCLNATTDMLEGTCVRNILFLLAVVLTSGAFTEVYAKETANDGDPVCIYVSSYHRGFEWSDRLEAGLRDTLTPHCRIVQFDMDSNRRKDPDQISAAAVDALRLIREQMPDVVVTSDDNAARYLVAPYLKGTETPVVFSGINWTIEEYGFPATNVTGIVEIAPIVALFDAAKKSVPDARRVAFFSADTLTQNKNFLRHSKIARQAGLDITHFSAITMNDWLNIFDQSQTYDFAIMGSIAGINDWTDDIALKHVEDNTSTLVITTHDWLMKYASLGFTIIPEEHGKWAGNAAAAILNGLPASAIPVVTNRKWDTWVNSALIEASGAQVPQRIVSGAKQVFSSKY